jgi:hypothetical protein
LLQEQQNFLHGRIFAIFAGVFLRKADTISPAKDVLVGCRTPAGSEQCALQQI